MLLTCGLPNYYNKSLMKKFALIVMLVCAVSVTARAGSEPSGKESATVAAAACHNWAGLYIGGFGAYSYDTVDVDLELTGPGWGSFPVEKGIVQGEGQHDLGHSAGELGGLIGYNWQYRPCWIFGLEVDGGGLWGRKSYGTGAFLPGGNFDPEHIETSFKTHYLTTVGFRVGHAWGNLLPYVIGGLAIADSDFSQVIYNIPASSFQQGRSKDNTDVGGMVGAGLQYALTDHWSVRGQYEFIDLGTFDFHHQTTDSGYFGTSQAKVHEQNLSFAVIFQF